MANNVNGQSSGYDKMDTLSTVHTTLLAELKQEIKDTRELVGKDKGFYVEGTCKKINTLIDSLEKQILPTLEKSFEASEKSVVSMERILISNDYF